MDFGEGRANRNAHECETEGDDTAHLAGNAPPQPQLDDVPGGGGGGGDDDDGSGDDGDDVIINSNHALRQHFPHLHAAQAMGISRLLMVAAHMHMTLDSCAVLG